jgi:uncharacterized membrane protein
MKSIRSRLEWFRLRLTPYRVFVVLGLFFGLLFCFLTPPFMVADEGGHFFRAYELADGRLISTKFDDTHVGGLIPKSVFNDVYLLMGNMAFHSEVKFDFATLKEALRHPLNQEDQMPAYYQCSAMYSPVPYLPDIAGIWLGIQFKAAPVILMYLGRIFTCIAAVLILGAAINIVPVHKWTAAAVFLTPMVLFQCASLSADPFTFAICFLFTALCWRLALEPDQKLTRHSIFVLGLTATTVCLAKQAYFPLLALLGFIPVALFENSQLKKWRIIGGILTISLGSMLAWDWAVSSIYTSCHAGLVNDPSAQLKHVFAHPLEFIDMVARACAANWKFYFASLLGGYLSWLELVIPSRYIGVIAWGALVISLFDGTSGKSLSLKFRLLNLALAVSMALVVVLLLYLSWNPVGATVFDGFTGRYAIPMVPMFMLLFYNRRLGELASARRWLPFVVIAFGLYSGIMTSVFLVQRFYLP